MDRASGNGQNQSVLAHGSTAATGHLDGAERLTSAYGDYNLAGCDPDALFDFVIVISAQTPTRASGVLRGGGGGGGWRPFEAERPGWNDPDDR